MPHKSNRYALLTLEKGLAALELIAESSRDVGVSELSTWLNEPVSVTFRVVRTLVDRGYVNQDPSTRRYSLGLRAWELGERAAARLDVRGVVQPTLDRLTSATGETASFALVQQDEYCYVATSDGRQPLRAYVERGSRLSLATPSASARAILAFSADEVVARILGGKLKRNTPTTVIEPARIRAILVETREKGVAVVHGENQQQLSAVAAPVCNANGKCIGAIALSGLTLRFQGEALKRMLQLVRAESEDVEAGLAVPSRSTQRDESSSAQVAVLRPKRARRR